MRRTSIFFAVAASALAGAAACTGGPGALPGFYDGWDDDRGAQSAREAPPSGTEPAVRGADQAPGQGGGPAGGGGFVCSGTYACTITDKGQTVTVNISLVEKDGQCTANDAVLAPDGTFLRVRDGGTEPQGSWQSDGSTLTVTTEDGAVVCIRSNGSGGGSSGGEDDPPPPPADPPTDGPGDIVVDAGG